MHLFTTKEIENSERSKGSGKIGQSRICKSDTDESGGQSAFKQQNRA